MKLLYIADSTIPSRSANSIHVMKMCQAFAQIGHEVILVCKKGYNKNHIDPYKFYKVKRSFKIVKIISPNIYGNPLIYGLLLSSFFIIKYKPDLVYSRSVFGSFAAAFLGYHTIFESHAPLFYELSITQWFQKQLFSHKNFKKLIVISNALKKQYQKELCLNNNSYNNINIIVAHDGADISDTSHQKDISIRKKALQVGYIGHLYRGRGINLIFSIAEKMPEVDFHLIGGTDEDLNALLSQNQLSNISIHGFVPPSEVDKFKNSCDVLIAPYQKKCSVSGGKGNTADFMSPLKIFEYMASKKPMVVSNLPVLSEILHKNSALLVPSDNVNAWVTAIDKLKDKGVRRHIANRAYIDFITHYTWKKRAENVLS